MRTMRVRTARQADLEAIMDIKQSLAVRQGEQMDEGGFLLGSSREVYAQLIHAQQVRLLCDERDVLGFCTTLDDALFRASAVWERRGEISWQDFSPHDFEQERVAYLDQLAMRHAAQRQYLGALLAMVTMAKLIVDGEHAHIFTTTLIEPMDNRSAIPLISKAGGRRVGTLRERYEGVGEVTSAIYHIDAQEHARAMARFREQGSAFERGVLASFDDLLARCA